MTELLKQLNNPPANVLSTVHSPVMAELDKIVQLQLLYPFATLGELAGKCGRPRGYISQITSSAAYKVLYDKRRREIADALGIPSTVEKLESAIQLTLEKLMDKVEETTDGNFLVKALEVLLKAGGQGGYAPAAAVNNTILVDARQAAIIGIRDKAMESARIAGPYPTGLGTATDVVESLPTITAASSFAATSPISISCSTLPLAVGAPRHAGIGDEASDEVMVYPVTALADPIASLEDELLTLPGTAPPAVDPLDEWEARLRRESRQPPIKDPGAQK